MNIVAALLRESGTSVLFPELLMDAGFEAAYLGIASTQTWLQQFEQSGNALIVVDDRDVHHVLQTARQVTDICFLRARGFPQIKILCALSIPAATWENLRSHMPAELIHVVANLPHPKGSTLRMSSTPGGPWQLAEVAGMYLRGTRSVMFATNAKGDPCCETDGYTFEARKAAA